MASEERKAADNKIKEQNFQSSLGAEEQQAETDAFQCSRCKQVRGSMFNLLLSINGPLRHRENVVTGKRKRGVPMNQWQYVTSFALILIATLIYIYVLDLRNVRIFSYPGRDEISDFAFLPDARTVTTGMLALLLYLPR
jgi:hypothetical protein